MNSVLCDAATYAVLPLLAVAAAVGSRRWLWLLIPYPLVLAVIALSSVRFGM